MEIPGIGPLASTAFVASVGNAITLRVQSRIWLHGWAWFHVNTLPVAGQRD